VRFPHRDISATVPRFLAGFLTASLLWCGLAFAYSRGIIDINLGPNAEPAAPDAGVEPEVEEDKRRGKRKRVARKGARKDRRFTGEAMTGDDLGDPETRNLEAAKAGGEEQLLGSEIERGFDSVFPQVRRCLMLAAGDEPVSGKVTFGLRISGQGGVDRVNLHGPAAITRSEAGDCLRKTARSIQFRKFNGPDMLVHFPLTLQ
jgi:hypothetical protein